VVIAYCCAPSRRVHIYLRKSRDDVVVVYVNRYFRPTFYASLLKVVDIGTAIGRDAELECGLMEKAVVWFRRGIENKTPSLR
jgi:hypothetical protein